MKIVILGAGELGKNLASTLSSDKHDVVIVDQETKLLDRLKDGLDIMTIHGNGASVKVLKEAEIKDADLFIAASGDEVSNILACQIARHFGVKLTICRLYSMEIFSEEDGFTPESIGISNIVIPEEECVSKIINVLDNQIVLEKILFSNDDAIMTAFAVEQESLICGVALNHFPEPELLKLVRFPAIVRRGQLIIPHGNTLLLPGDEVYVSGRCENVQKMVDWATPKNSEIKRIIIIGATRIGKNLALKLNDNGYDVRLIEEDLNKGELLLENLSAGVMVLHGSPTDSDVLSEAGVTVCDAFISTLADDEDNILSCILAKKQGAKKVIAVTNKSEYVDIVPDMAMIDCGFNASLVSVNTVLRTLGTGTGMLSIDALLHRVRAYVFEFKIYSYSEVCNKKIFEINMPAEAVFALVFRDGDVICPSGDFELLEGDIVSVISSPETGKALGPIFNKKGVF